MNDLPAELLRARTKLGLTQQKAAEILGMSRRKFIEIELGRRAVAPYELHGILKALKKPL